MVHYILACQTKQINVRFEGDLLAIDQEMLIPKWHDRKILVYLFCSHGRIMERNGAPMFKALFNIAEISVCVLLEYVVRTLDLREAINFLPASVSSGVGKILYFPISF